MAPLPAPCPLASRLRLPCTSFASCPRLPLSIRTSPTRNHPPCTTHNRIVVANVLCAMVAMVTPAPPRHGMAASVYPPLLLYCATRSKRRLHCCRCSLRRSLTVQGAAPTPVAELPLVYAAPAPPPVDAAPAAALACNPTILRDLHW